MPLEEQTELFAQQIRGLGRFQFLLRPAIAEGHIGSAVLPLSIRDEDIDKDTGEYQFPDAQLVARLRTALAKQAGIPIARLLQEQDARLPQALPETTRRLSPPQQRLRQPQTNGYQEQKRPGAQPTLTHSRGRQPSRLPHTYRLSRCGTQSLRHRRHPQCPGRQQQ